MDQIDKGISCQHTNELIGVLYGEATESEATQFQQHLQGCAMCEAEIRAFQNVRKSITNWKFDVFAPPTQSPVNITAPVPRTKSAIAAFKEFFDLSPLWLKAATTLAAILLCVFSVITFAKFKTQPASVVGVGSQNQLYTADEMKEIVKEALAAQKSALQVETLRKPDAQSVEEPTLRFRRPRLTNQTASDRRPLTRIEREQLAADLRLIEKEDDDVLLLLSEPLDRN